MKIVIRCALAVCLTILPVQQVYADGSDGLAASPLMFTGSAEISATRGGAIILLTATVMVVGGVIVVTQLDASQRRNNPGEWALQFVNEDGIINVTEGKRDDVLSIIHSEIDLLDAINSDEGRNETAIAEIARRLNTDLDMIHALLMQARDVADEVRAEHNPEGKQVIPVRPSQFVSKYSDLDEPVQNFVKNYAALRGIVLESKARSLAIDALKGAGGILRDAIFQDR